MLGTEEQKQMRCQVEVPMVQKRRRLMRAGMIIPARENVSAEEARLTRDAAEQREVGIGGGEGSVAIERSRSGDRHEEGQEALPLVLVPFEPVTEEETLAQRKQTAKVRKLQALTDTQAMLCAVLGRLGRIEGERGESSASGATRSKNEGGKGARPYVPNWPRVTTNSNLSTADEKQEWLLNCLPPTILEAYNMLVVGSVISLGVQSALLVSVLL